MEPPCAWMAAWSGPLFDRSEKAAFVILDLIIIVAHPESVETHCGSSLYETDFYRWTELMAARLRERRAHELDWNHIEEEIESLGRSDRRELRTRLSVLLSHLLKWQYQPEMRLGSSWRDTIDEQRGQIQGLMEDSPSLLPYIDEVWTRSYERAVRLAARDTRLSPSHFLRSCPYPVGNVLRDDFLPGEQ